MNFEDEIKKGNFVISECKSCNKIIWPPNDICNSCFGITKWRKASKNGKILDEFSVKEISKFGTNGFLNTSKIACYGLNSANDGIGSHF